eukprot:gene433-6846_t
MLKLAEFFFPRVYQLRNQQLISFSNNEDEDVLNKITQGRDPFDEIDAETMETIKYDPKKELPLYSKLSIEEAQQSANGEKKLLEKYSSTTLKTRRAVDTSKDILDSFHQKKPNSVDELYEETLPEMRSKLRNKGLKQVGFLKPISQIDFEKYKYSIQNNPNKQHDAFNPTAKMDDKTLEFLEPKQWIGEKLPEATDDLAKEALDGLKIDFRLHDIKIGELIKYSIQIKTISDLELDLIFQISIIKVNNLKVIVQAEKNIKVSGDKWHKFEGNLSIDTSHLETGTYQGFCKVFKDTKENMIDLLGPFEYHLTQE